MNNNKRKTWLWVLGWIFIFPLPLTLILLKKPDMDKKIKYGIIAAAWILYAVIIFVVPSGNKKTDKTTQEPTQAVTETVTEKSTEAPTESPTEPPTEEPTEPPTEKPTEEPTEAPTPIVFTSYTNSIEAGSFGSVTIQAAPNTEYSITVNYSSGAAEADGLEPKYSDANGYVTWEWKVGNNTKPGEYSITVTGGRSRETVKFSVFN